MNRLLSQKDREIRTKAIAVIEGSSSEYSVEAAKKILLRFGWNEERIKYAMRSLALHKQLS